MWYDTIFGRLTTVDRETIARCIALLNRADPDMLEYLQYNTDRCDPSKGGTYKLAKEFGHLLINNTHEVLGKPPMYKDGKFFLLLIHSCSNFRFIVTFPTAPHTEVAEKDKIKYSEVVRENVRKLKAYIEEMASDDTISGAVAGRWLNTASQSLAAVALLLLSFPSTRPPNRMSRLSSTTSTPTLVWISTTPFHLLASPRTVVRWTASTIDLSLLTV